MYYTHNTLYSFVKFYLFFASKYCVQKSNVKYKRIKCSVKRKFWVILFVILFIVVLFVVYYYKVICPVIVKLSEEKVRSISTSTISEVVGKTLVEENIKYSDIVKINYSSSGEIDLIEVDIVETNLLIRKITKGVQDEFNVLNRQNVEIAFGTFTGIPFLYDIGPKIEVQLIPIGTVNTKINSQFKSAGINQTFHQINFLVTASIGMVLPAKTENFITELEVLLCESVIVGKVPEVYLQGNLI